MMEEEKVEVVWSVVDGKVVHTGELIPGDISQSVAKWKAISKQDTVVNRGIGRYDCPLCMKYLTLDMVVYANVSGNTSECCVGCPVHDLTGKTECKGSPYDGLLRCRYDAKGFRAWARLEYLFLKALADGDTERAKHYLLNEA